MIKIISDCIKHTQQNTFEEFTELQEKFIGKTPKILAALVAFIVKVQ